jgi:hypothetical protein
MSSTREEREAEVAELCRRAQDPDDEYDGHHGTDRSPESLEWARVNDPETFARVAAKMVQPGGEYRG